MTISNETQRTVQQVRVDGYSRTALLIRVPRPRRILATLDPRTWQLSPQEFLYPWQTNDPR
jgi:hypothetical protein